MKEKTCGMCKHWHQAPINPTNIAAPRPGQCRGEPPQMFNAIGPQGIGLICDYPQTPAEFPACGIFEATEGSKMVLPK